MPRYFFNVENDGLSAEETGSEFPDLATAKCEAVKFAGTFVCHEADIFWERREWRLNVSDHNGAPLFSIRVLGEDAPS